MFGRFWSLTAINWRTIMTQLDKQINKIIVSLKRTDGLEAVRFVREFGSHTVEMPIVGAVAVVSVRETAVSHAFIGDMATASLRGEQYSANVQIRVFVPNSESGAGLSELVSAIMHGLKSVDENRIITEVSASPIAFDSDMNTIYRNVDFGLDFCLCEEETDE